ncbi:hypothetical protein [Dyella tabacisoli]|uniref:Uncharacterized protein n=1 Tax=Dyella tabacisoli TaxID=2282381 RepID=A0A369URK5_9GAMM|nr:hypothetical protein [Dyella tabacisoli]RDD83394.1 hypothetical protein DVJ77_02080 [Dyella tabacisoli]
MDELLNKAMNGVDPDAPGAFWQVFLNLMGIVPWGALFWWSVGFVVVGAALGWWRGRLLEGVVWAALLGPIGWFVVLARPRTKPGAGPPPLPPKTSSKRPV